MANFQFQIAQNPEDNIAAFFDHLKSHDKEMAKILLDNLSLIHPLSDNPQQRSIARKLFNSSVLTALIEAELAKEKNAS